MTDLEMTKLCAGAMGYDYAVLNPADASFVYCHGTGPGEYAPLRNDAQAMALARRFMMTLDFFAGHAALPIPGSFGERHSTFSDESINRAIVECVAAMQFDRTAQETSTRSAEE